jgi:hypothetical protein
MSKLQKKPAAHKRDHPTLQNMNFFYFCGSFLPSWIRIRIPNTDPDPDPLARLNTDPIRIRIRNPAFYPQIVTKLRKIWVWDPGYGGQKGKTAIFVSCLTHNGGYHISTGKGLLYFSLEEPRNVKFRNLSKVKGDLLFITRSLKALWRMPLFLHLFSIIQQIHS